MGKRIFNFKSNINNKYNHFRKFKYNKNTDLISKFIPYKKLKDFALENTLGKLPIFGDYFKRVGSSFVDSVIDNI